MHGKAKTKIMILFKNGTSTTLESTLTHDEAQSLFANATGTRVEFSAFESSPNISRVTVSLVRDEILFYSVFELVESPIMTLPEKKLVRA